MQLSAMACCPSHGIDTSTSFTWERPVPAEATSTPAWAAGFTETTIKSNLPDGYWIEAFPFRTTPDKHEGPVGPEVIAYGLGFMGKDDKPIPSEVRMYLNPYDRIANQIKALYEWPSVVIQKLDYPVALTYGNFRPKSGVNDVIICHDYGKSMDALNMKGGIVSYLKNPGHRKAGMWERREIGRFPSMHRLKTGYFTQKHHLEIMGLPIMVESGDRKTPAPVIIYKPTKWDDDGTPSEWETSRPLDNTFRLIHDVEIIPSSTGGLDKALVAGREGINLMWYDEKSQQWKHENVGSGIPQTRKPFKNPYWGSGSVAAARVGNDSVGYIASCEAFHGNLVSVYVKPPNTRPDQVVTKEYWRRFVIDDFGPLRGEGHFTGTIHNVQCADLDGSGVESIIVACMGYPEGKAENMGTYVYRPLDLQRGLFARSKISDASAGRIAVADFRCSGTLDVATISYAVPNYLESPNPALRVMLNNTPQTRCAIKAHKLGDEVMIRVPRADEATYISEMPFLDIAGKLLSIVVLPPNKEYLLGSGFKYHDIDYQKDGVKVINGHLSWTKAGQTIRRGIAVEPKKSASMIPNADGNVVKAGPGGAIFIRLASSITTTLPDMKFDNMDDVATINYLPFGVDPAVRNMVFPWVACKDRKWGQGKFDWPFYNLVGYHILYDDDSLTNFCHIQAWTLGVGQTAAFHNHDNKSFCEIHACISNGTHRGGMYWAKDQDGDKHLGKNPEEKDLSNLKQYADMVVVDDMEEHGPLWHITEEGLPKLRPNDTVDYPYHAWLAGPRKEVEAEVDAWVDADAEVEVDDDGYTEVEAEADTEVSTKVDVEVKTEDKNKDEAEAEAFDVWLAFEFPASEFQSNE